MPANGASKKSRSTKTFLVAADVQAFSALLAPRIEDMAAWSTSAGTWWGADLVQVLAASGTRAHLQLADRQGVPRGPLIQYRHGGVHTFDGREILPDGRRVPVNGRETLTDGSLAYAWFPADEPAEIQERFRELARQAWGCLLQVTHPHVARWNGKPIRSWRIGSHAKVWLGEDPAAGSATGAAFTGLYRPERRPDRLLVLAPERGSLRFDLDQVPISSLAVRGALVGSHEPGQPFLRDRVRGRNLKTRKPHC